MISILLLLTNLYCLLFNIVYTQQVELIHKLGIEELIKINNGNFSSINEDFILSNLVNLNNTISNILKDLSIKENKELNLLGYKTLLKNISDNISNEIVDCLNDHFDILDNINNEWKKINALIIFHDPNSDLAISDSNLYNRLNNGSIENSIEFLNIFSHKNKDCLIKKLNRLLKKRYESQSYVINKVILLKKILIEIELTKMIYLYNNKKPNSNIVEIMIPKFLRMLKVLENLERLLSGNFEKPYEISIIKIINLNMNDTPIPDTNFVVYPNLDILLGFDDDSYETNIEINEIQKSNLNNCHINDNYVDLLNRNDELYSLGNESDDLDNEAFDGRYNSLDKFKRTLNEPNKPRLIDDNIILNKEEDLDDDEKVAEKLKRFFRKLVQLKNDQNNFTDYSDILSSLSPSFLENLFSDEYNNTSNISMNKTVNINETNILDIEENNLINEMTTSIFNEITNSLNNKTNNLDEINNLNNGTNLLNETDIVLNEIINSLNNSRMNLINGMNNVSSNFGSKIKNHNKDQLEYKNQKIINNRNIVNSIKKNYLLRDEEKLDIINKKCLSSLHVCPIVRHLDYNEMLKFDRSLFTYKDKLYLEKDKIIIWLVSESLLENYGARARLLELITLKIMDINRVIDRSVPIMNVGNEEDNIKFYREKHRKVLSILISLKHFLNSENSFDIANRRIAFLELFVPSYGKELIQELNHFDSNYKLSKDSNLSSQSNKEYFFKLRNSNRNKYNQESILIESLQNNNTYTYSEPTLPELCTRFIAVISVTKSVNSFCDNSYKFGQKVCSMIFEIPMHNLLSNEDYSWLTGISLMRNVNGLINLYKLPEALHVNHKNVLRALNYSFSQKIYNIHQACTQSLISQKNTVLYQNNISVHIIKSIFKVACAEFFGISLFLYDI